MESQCRPKRHFKDDFLAAIEAEAVKGYVVDSIRMKGHGNRIDPDLWR